MLFCAAQDRESICLFFKSARLGERSSFLTKQNAVVALVASALIVYVIQRHLKKKRAEATIKSVGKMVEVGSSFLPPPATPLLRSPLPGAYRTGIAGTPTIVKTPGSRGARTPSESHLKKPLSVSDLLRRARMAPSPTGATVPSMRFSPDIEIAVTPAKEEEPHQVPDGVLVNGSLPVRRARLYPVLPPRRGETTLAVPQGPEAVVLSKEPLDPLEEGMDALFGQQSAPWVSPFPSPCSAPLEGGDKVPFLSLSEPALQEKTPKVTPASTEPVFFGQEVKKKGLLVRSPSSFSYR